jgi:hypothetical protein
MKKFFVAVAVVALVAFSAPVFASTNPFMDVPMNHWAYDAIGQLAAHGILSGYPDGTYKGKQPTTRYEMASALARALAVVDMTKASKQDVEMLKKLVVEFKDELEALGVRVDDLDERVKVLEDRLGGWHIHGVMRLDLTHSKEDAPRPESNANLSRARLFFERYFGEDESLFFRARLDNDWNSGANWQQFYVTMPFFFDSRLYVGRFLAFEEMSPYYLGGDTSLPATGGFAGLDDIIGDRNVTGLGFEKQFGLGSVYAYVSHPNNWSVEYPDPGDGDSKKLSALGAWELYLMGKLQFTEQFGFDLGGHAYIGDNAELRWTNDNGTQGGYSWKNLWTVWAGLRFDFNENIAFRGIYYHQKWNGDVWVNRGGRYGWYDRDQDAANHFRVLVDVKQELLKFTSLWLEYGQVDGGFHVPTGLTAGAFFGGADVGDGQNMPDDLKYWRVALGQEWNEKWATHLFYFGYDFDRMQDLAEWGLGVRYTYNPNVKFGLNYVHVNWKDSDDDHVVRLRTEITF